MHFQFICHNFVVQSPMSASKQIGNYCLPTGLQNSAEDSMLKWYKELQETAARCSQSFEQLNSPKDAQVSLRFSSGIFII